MDLRLGAFGQVLAAAERLDHAGGRAAGVVAEELPERAGITNGRLEADVRGLRPGGGEKRWIEAVRGAEWRALGGIVEDACG